MHGQKTTIGYRFGDLRGIPALRYQGQGVITAEAEYLWGITPRWGLALTDLLPFSGLESGEIPVVYPHADQAQSGVPNGSRHTPNLTVSAFGDGQLQPAAWDGRPVSDRRVAWPQRIRFVH